MNLSNICLEKTQMYYYLTKERNILRQLQKEGVQ